VLAVGKGVSAMNYVQSVIADLQAGKTVAQYREKGNSMLPIIKSGEPVTLAPITDPSTLEIGDIVLCRVGGSVLTHKITAKQGKADKLRFQISNNHGHVNGWTRAVYGKVVAINGKPY
jgi:hypothetical protein